jgi:hypothetical protein
MRWRRIVQSIINRIARKQRNPTAVNVVVEASDGGQGDVFSVFGSAGYDQNVIEEFLERMRDGPKPVRRRRSRGPRA